MKRYQNEKMKTDTLFKMWLSILVIFLLSLSIWSIFFIDKNEHKIAIFGIVGAIVTALTSVLSINLNHKKNKEREIDLLIIKEGPSGNSVGYVFKLTSGTDRVRRRKNRSPS